MKRLKASNLIILLALIVLSITGGCSKDKDIMETVPSSAGPVVSINAVKFMRTLEGVKYGGKFTADSTLNIFLENISDVARPYVRTLLTTRNIDRDHIVAFSTTDEKSGVNFLTFLHHTDIIVTFNIINIDGLTDELGAQPAQNEGDFTAYRLNNAVMLVKGHQGWLLNDDVDAAVDKLNIQLQLAANAPMSAVKGVSSFIESPEDIIRMVIPANSDILKGWTCVTTDIDDRNRELEIGAEFIDLNGQKVSFGKHMKDIDSKLLAYLAPSDIITLGIGLKGDTDWDAVFQYVQSIFPMSFKQRAFAGMIQSYLKRIDGTVLVSAGPTVSDMKEFDPSKMSVFVAVEMKSDQAKSTISDLEGIIKMTGFPSVKKDDEIIIQIPEMLPVTVKLLDKRCLVITNRPLQQPGNAEASKTLKDNVAGLWCSIPDALAESAYGGPGLRCTIEVDDDFELKGGFTDTSLPFIEQIIETFSSASVQNNPSPVPSSDNDLGFVPLDTIR